MKGNLSGFVNKIRVAALAVALIIHQSPAPTVQASQISSRGSAAISVPDTSNFPDISLNLDVYDPSGGFISDLIPEQVRIVEDNRVLPLTGFNLTPVGVHFILAFNPSSSLANYYASIRRIDRIKTSLLDWVSFQLDNTRDRLTLIDNQRVLLEYEPSPALWEKAITSFNPELKDVQPSLSSLSMALDEATESGSSERNLKRAILYITPVVDAANLGSIKDMTDRAVQAGVRVFVWLVGPDINRETQVGQAFAQMAARTNGSLQVFSGAQTLPNLDTYLQPLRQFYSLSYSSSIRTTGRHSVSVRIERRDMQLATEERIFAFQVTPPNPIFMSPPSQVTRSWQMPENSDKKRFLTPDEAVLKVMIIFPDGHTRGIERLTLFVDGHEAAELSSPPYTAIAWNLQPYEKSGSHTLQLSTVDVLGLTSYSIEMPVEIIVESPPLTPLQSVAAFFTPERLGVLFVLLVSASLLGRVLIKRWRRNAPPRRKKQDPLTQPVEILQDAALLPVVGDAPAWPRTPGGRPAPARLVVLSSTLPNLKPGSSLALYQAETLLGSDARVAAIVLDSPSVSALHARIIREEDGAFHICDEKSIAGTWLNFAPVSIRGARLEHGDLLYLGRVHLRFERADGAARQVEVIRLSE